MACLAISVAAGQVLASALIDPVIDRAHALRRELRLAAGVKKEVRDLTRTLELIKSFLMDAEEKQIKTRAVHTWLMHLREVLYDADDLLDEYATDTALRLMTDDTRPPIARWKAKVSDLLCCFVTGGGTHNVLSNSAMVRSVRAITEGLDKIGKDRHNLGLQVPTESNQIETTLGWRRRETSSLEDESMLIGRDEVKMKILGLLSVSDCVEGNHANKSVLVLPIIGMGGIGKTALARLIFNDRKVEEHFHLRIWICLSDDFDVIRHTKGIIESISIYQGSGQSCDLTTLTTLQNKLQGMVKEKRYLLVLDDAWNEKPYLWDRLLAPLKHGGVGSRVLVTTRASNVSDAIAIADRMEPIRLDGLPDDDIWKIFKAQALGNDSSVEHLQFEDIGQKIVKKLKGSPLAAKSIGSLLSNSTDIRFWDGVLKNDLWTFKQEKEDDIFPILKISYQHLPSHLKQCFAYCSLFPKDLQFTREELSHLWMAQNFIQTENGKRTEDAGISLFDSLLSRLFFEKYGATTYVMHDLIHDLAQSVSEDECVWVNDSVPNTYSEMARHASIFNHKVDLQTLEDISHCERLRTLLFKFPRGFQRIPNVASVLDDWLRKLRWLRVLGLTGCNIMELPESISNLKHLRYLDLSWTPLVKLPKNWRNLYNLQVLNLYACFELNTLPVGITELVNLRHLQARPRLLSALDGIGKLTSLQGLKKFEVHKINGHKIGELKDLNMLRGELTIENLENVESEEQAREARLDQKECIEELALQWCDKKGVRSSNCSSRHEIESEEGVLEALRPSAYLKRLTITCHQGVKVPSWLEDLSLPYLDSVHVQDCRNWTTLPPLGLLKFLKVLELSGMTGLEQVGLPFYGNGIPVPFPCLEKLVFSHMPKLEEWKGVASHLPRLCSLVLIDCPKLKFMPPIPPSLTELKMKIVGLSALPEMETMGHDKMNGGRGHTSFPISPALTSLHIRNCPKLISLNDGFLRKQLKDLEKLKIVNCEALKQLPTTGFSLLVSLKILWMVDCPNLSMLSSLSSGESASLPSSLQHFWVKNCGDLETTFTAQLQNLTLLTNLTFHDCPNIAYLQTEVLSPLTALRELSIQCCKNLTSFNFAALKSIEKLTIVDCPNLTITPFLKSASCSDLCINECNTNLLTGCLQVMDPIFLRALRITKCQDLVSLQDGGELEVAFNKLKALEILDISNCINFTSFSMGSPSFASSLKHLDIFRCGNLQSLPADLRNLSSLQELQIQLCPQIQSLPEKGLPDSMQYLRITGCPLLKDRCISQESQIGLDYTKISHIPKVVIY